MSRVMTVSYWYNGTTYSTHIPPLKFQIYFALNLSHILAKGYFIFILSVILWQCTIINAITWIGCNNESFYLAFPHETPSLLCERWLEHKSTIYSCKYNTVDGACNKISSDISFPINITRHILLKCYVVIMTRGKFKFRVSKLCFFKHVLPFQTHFEFY